MASRKGYSFELAALGVAVSAVMIPLGPEAIFSVAALTAAAISANVVFSTGRRVPT